MSPQPVPAPPVPLHFLRLAEAQPGVWVALPGGGLRVVQPLGKLSAAGAGWLLCLRGEVVVDLPERQFVQLRLGEGVALGRDWQALPTRGDSVLLLIESAGG